MRRPNWWKKACAVCVLCAATAIALPGQTFTVLQSLDYTDGAGPAAGLIQATDGNLYGTTSTGGTTRDCYGDGCGTVFKITPRGALATLYTFDLTDGSQPFAAVVQGSDGNFFGTTITGGAYNEGANLGGTVFEITATGPLTSLYSFCSQSGCTDGQFPSAGLVEVTDGNFYGTTSLGGANSCISGSQNDGCGTVFKITPNGVLTTLHSFDGSDGYYPYAGLVQATDGNLYGSTAEGGSKGSCYNESGCGTVFKIPPSGTLTMLYSFCSKKHCTDGRSPSGLIQALDGNFYGTTSYGGAHGTGTVFKITPTGTLTTLYSFCSQAGCTDGVTPSAALVQATDGNFYGTTLFGGSGTACDGPCGTVFKITPRGELATLHSFDLTDGEHPVAALVQDTNGKLYGTAQSGGTGGPCNGGSVGCGTVFVLSVGLGPFVETRPTSGAVGKPVKILGTNLTGATSVTFNGTAATFTLVSSSLIGTTVPAGATTGTLQVVTPGGTLSSNVPFRVLP